MISQGRHPTGLELQSLVSNDTQIAFVCSCPAPSLDPAASACRMNLRRLYLESR